MKDDDIYMMNSSKSIVRGISSSNVETATAAATATTTTTTMTENNTTATNNNTPTEMERVSFRGYNDPELVKVLLRRIDSVLYSRSLLSQS